jgi:probable rRNA maturation factor
MIRGKSGAGVAVSNRQRRRKVDARALAGLVRCVLDLVHDHDSQLGIVLVDDATIAKLNAQYHATPGPTDVLSFDYGEGHGELIISVECAVRQAKRFRTTPARELALYVVHGILHLHGYDDRTTKGQRRMRAAERQLMSRLGRNVEFKAVISQRMAERKRLVLGTRQRNRRNEEKRH